MKKNLINQLTKKTINNILKNRKLENLSLIQKTEKIFLEKRGFTIRIPKPKTPVILIVSGGLDSIGVWAYLMKVYQLQVYPLFLKRGQRREKIEEKAVDSFYNYYKQIYPNLCQPVKKMRTYIPPLEIRFSITIASNKKRYKNGRWMGIPMYSSLMCNYATQYAYFLEIIKNVKIRTIFAGFMSSDGLVMKDETLTAMRINNLSITELTDDYSWQIIALPIEKELGFFHNKEVFLKWAIKENIPMEKTRSCIMWGKYHCGQCVSCSTRKMAFRNAKIVDKTIYGQSKLERLKTKINKVLMNH